MVASEPAAVSAPILTAETVLVWMVLRAAGGVAAADSTGRLYVKRYLQCDDRWREPGHCPTRSPRGREPVTGLTACAHGSLSLYLLTTVKNCRIDDYLKMPS